MVKPAASGPSMVALHGADVVPVTALGLRAGRVTQGHRFEAAHQALQVEGDAARLWRADAVAQLAGRRKDARTVGAQPRRRGDHHLPVFEEDHVPRVG